MKRTATLLTPTIPQTDVRERAEASPADGAREHSVSAKITDDQPTPAIPHSSPQRMRLAGGTKGTRPGLTAEQSTLVYDDGFGGSRTVPVETELRDFDAYPMDPDRSLPWLAARVVLVDDRSQAYGRETRVWIDYGSTTGELSPAQAREALEAMRGFVAKLEAVVELAEEVGAGDFEGDPEIADADREAMRRIHARVNSRP